VQDRPTALELLRAVRGFLETDVLPGLEGRKRFHGLVAANVLAIVERELAGEEAQLAAEWARLGALFGDAGERPATLAALRDAVRALEARLAEEIRAGRHDDDGAVRAHVRATVVEKLAVANPGFGGAPKA
jgi:hypothetical protein